MSGPDAEIELLSHGPEGEPRHPRRQVPPRWDPRKARALLAVVAVIGAVWVGYRLTGPRIPTVEFSAAIPIPSGTTAGQPPWQAAPDGRPAGKVHILVSTEISASGQPDERVTVVGVAGPGIVNDSSPSIALSATHLTPAVLSADLDCARIRFPVRAADYQIRMQVTAGSRSATGTVPGGALSSRWAAISQALCGSWLARRNLTIVAASATVDTSQPIADLTLTIANEGSVAAYLRADWNSGSMVATPRSAAETTLAPATASTLHLHVAIGDCDLVPPAPALTAGQLMTSDDYLGVVALAGSRPGPPATDNALGVDGQAPTGIIMTPTAMTAIFEALRSACGGLDQFVTLISSHGIVLDRVHRLLTARINIDGTPGKIHDIELFSDPAAPDPNAFTPLWSTTPPLVPDTNGQLTVTFRYRVPTASACPFRGAWIPGFTMIVEVEVAGRLKTLHYTQSIDPSQDEDAIRVLC